MKSPNFLQAVLIAAGIVANTNAALIEVGDSLTISGVIDAGKSQAGYVSFDRGPVAYVYAGPLVVQVVNHSQAGRSFELATFCTDVGIPWAGGPKEFLAVPNAAYRGIAPSWANNPAAMENALWLYNEIFVPNTATLSAAQGAGVQLAIWKVLYDTAPGGTVRFETFDSGRLRASGFGGIQEAEQYIGELNSARTGAFSVSDGPWLKPVHNDTQGLVFTGQIAVPEPDTWIAGAVLFVPFAASTLGILFPRNWRSRPEGRGLRQ